jgi:hypothetical protein
VNHQLEHAPRKETTKKGVENKGPDNKGADNEDSHHGGVKEVGAKEGGAKEGGVEEGKGVEVGKEGDEIKEASLRHERANRSARLHQPQP